MRYFRNDLYLGDQSAVLKKGKVQTTKDYLKTQERIDGLKKWRRRNEGKQRKKKKKKKQNGKKKQEKFLTKISNRMRLNETLVSQLDVTCFPKGSSKKDLIKAPLIEHAHPKYARFVFTSIKTICINFS